MKYASRKNSFKEKKKTCSEENIYRFIINIKKNVYIYKMNKFIYKMNNNNNIFELYFFIKIKILSIKKKIIIYFN